MAIEPLPSTEDDAAAGIPKAAEAAVRLLNFKSCLTPASSLRMSEACWRSSGSFFQCALDYFGQLQSRSSTGFRAETLQRHLYKFPAAFAFAEPLWACVPLCDNGTYWPAQ